ncbi:MAG: secretin N-terminal domain-containing protein [Phycisphaerales bacterium]
MRTPIRYFALCLALVGGAWLRSADAQSEIRLPVSSSLADLVEFVGERLDLSLEYARGELSGDVSLQIRDEVSDDELWSVLTSVLEGRGFVVVEAEREGLYRVVRLNQAAANNQQIVLPDDTRNIDFANFVSVVTRLESLPASDAANAIKPVLTAQGGSATAIGNSGLLLISDVRRRVDDALALLELLDSPADQVVQFTVELEHASASELSMLIETLETARGTASASPATGTSQKPQSAFIRSVALPDDRRLVVFAPSSRENAIRSLIDDLDARESSETDSYSVAGVAPGDLAESVGALLDASTAGRSPSDAGRVRIRVDRLTSSVLVTAPGHAHERIRRFVESLESSPAANRRVVRSFRVKNRDASDLAATLESIIGLNTVGTNAAAITQGSADSPRQNRAATDPATGYSGSSVTMLTGGQLTLNVDAHTNTIIAVGDSAMIEQLESLITDLDRRQPQVMVEITLVSLSEGDALDLGVELTQQFERGGTVFNLSSLFGLGSGAATGGLSSGSGFTGNIINAGDFSVLVRAVEAISDGRTISVPKILANNNAQSSVRGVAREPFTSINASDTVATTSFGGTEDAGTTVTVTPQIAEGDHVVLEYAIELSAFTGEAVATEGGGVVPPSSQQNSFEGSVTVPDGHVVIIGGLDNVTDTNSRSQVPLFGDLPIIGALFGATSNSDTRSRFYAFIHVTILRDAGFEDLKSISRGDLAGAGVSDGHPTLSPLWIE